MKSFLTLISLGLALVMATPVSAQEMPYSPGDYWEVNGIEIEDGQSLAYMQFIATKWKAEQEFAKSKGWIKAYHVLGNVYARDGEPDLYLVSVMQNLPTNSQIEQRNAEYEAWSKASLTQLEAESAGRASIRRQTGSMLLQSAILK